MKKLLSLALALALFATAACACAKNEESSANSKKEESSSNEKKPVYTKKEVNAYPLNEEKPIVFNCLFSDALPEVPFTDAEDYLNQLFVKKVDCKKGENGTFTFTNQGGAITVDADKDIISSDCIEAFAVAECKPYAEYFEADYIKNKGNSTDDEIKPFSIDLSKYGIDVVESDGKVYLPFCTLGDLFADIGCGVVYKDGELFFKSTSDLINSGSGHAKLGDTRTKEMADFSYRELCMTMDTVYGLPSMSRLTPSIREKGFDEALSSYNSVTPRIKELLHSESIKDYCKGMRLLNYYLFDGGHTQMDYGLERMMEKYGIPNAAGVAEELLDESEPERAKIRADVNEKLEMTEMKSSLVAEKTAAYEKLELVLSGDGTALYRSGDTYFFDFNSFKNAVVKPFKEALDYAKDHNAKNFVIDLSTNGGGGDYIVNYMLAVILGEDTHFNKSIASGSTVKTNILVDKNLDGKFDEKDDAVKYDFRFAVITSKYSYSNANCMPCAAQDGGVAILGESSGGGSCVISGHFTPDGILYSISGSSLDIHPNGEDVDAGTAPDTALSGAKEGYKGFYDIDAINKGIDAFYNK